MNKFFSLGFIALFSFSFQGQAQTIPSTSPVPPLAEPIPLGISSGPVSRPAISPLPFPGPMGGGENPNDLTLSPLAPTAFMEEPAILESTWFGNFGARALMRKHTQQFVTAYLNPTNTDSGTVPNFATLPGLQNFRDLNPPMSWGPAVTLGIIHNNHILEFYGFYIPQNSKAISVSLPGQLSSPFGSVPPPPFAPIGFQGNNGLVLNADTITTTFNTALGNAEFNYRYCSNAVKDFEIVIGIRYFDMQENMVVSTNDDGLVFPTNPILVADYNSRSHNHMLNAQVGYEYNARILPHVGIGSMGKGGIGPNWWQSQVSLTRGDGLEGFNGSQAGTAFSSIFELSLYADILLLERARMRVGYNVMWLIGVSEAAAQFDYNLRNQSGSRDIGSAFYQGPTLDFQFLF
ncbi:MAG: hypothetical protein EXR99_01405 [Gemmataceae bacterium]|nr:hypothetical protein [Gemmataceae bacterium]